MDTQEKYAHETDLSPEIIDDLPREAQIHEKPLDATPKTRWERSWPVFACGAGLFSDGYVNGVGLAPSSPGALL